MDRITSLARVTALCLASVSLSGCAGAIVGAAADVAIEIAKVPFKVVGAAVDIVTDDDDDDDTDTDDKDS